MNNLDVKTQQLLNKLLKNTGNINRCSSDADNVEKYLSDLQKNILYDESTYKTLEAGRRAGKSILLAAALIYPALKEKDVETIYIGLTKTSAKSIIWDSLKKILNDLNIKHKSNLVELNIVFPNKSKITISGCHNKREAETFRGHKYRLIAIDEAAAFGNHIEYLIDDILRATLADHPNSEIYLSSTPNARCKGYFHSVCTGEDSKWRLWHWDMRDNEKFPRWSDQQNWQEQATIYFEEVREQYKSEKKENKFVREWEAKWVKDIETLLFPQLPTVNSVPNNLMHYIGMDVGFNDPSSIVVVGVEPETKIAYLVDAWQDSEVLTTDLTKILKEKIEQYNVVCVCADPGGGGKRLIEDLNYLHKLNIKSAQKPQGRKSIDVELISDLFKKERINILSSESEALDELGCIQWEDRGEGKIDSRYADHILDALIYAFREFMQYMSEPEPRDTSLDDIDPHKLYLVRQIQAEKEFERELYDYD